MGPSVQRIFIPMFYFRTNDLQVKLERPGGNAWHSEANNVTVWMVRDKTQGFHLKLLVNRISYCYRDLWVSFKLKLNVTMCDYFTGRSLFDGNRTGQQTQKMKIDRPLLTQPGTWECNEWMPCVPSKQSCERTCTSLKQCSAKCFLWSVKVGCLQFAQYDWKMYLFIPKHFQSPMYHLSYDRY